MAEEKVGWFSFTNLLVVIALAINAIVFAKLNSIEDKIFLHLTNSELHIPRATIVSKDEFSIYQVMRDRQMAEIKQDVNDIKCMLQSHMGIK